MKRFLIAILLMTGGSAAAQVNTLSSPCVGTFSRKSYFLDLQAQQDVRITGFSLMSQNCGTRDMSLYYRQGPFLGFESNPAAWIFLDSVANFTPVCSLSCPIPPTQIPFELNICIPEGATYSFLIATTAGTGSIESHNTLPQGSIGAQDANLTLFTGMGHNMLTPFAASGSMVNGLTWQGEVFYQVLDLDLGNDTTICQGQSLTLSPGAGYTSYNWSTGDTSSTLAVDTTGIYALSVTTASGCTLTDSIEVNVIVCTGISETGNNAELLYLYPNPAIDHVTILSVNELSIQRITINDLMGRQIQQYVHPQGTSSETIMIPIGDLPSGYYHLTVIHAGGLVTRSFVKTNQR